MELKETILKLLYPPKCVFCGKILKEKENRVCRACANSVYYQQGKYARQSFPNIQICISPLLYEGKVKESLQRYKFSSMACYAPVYADIMVAASQKEELDVDIITWIPLSRQRLRRRGYDQARLLAEEVSLRTGITCVQLLKKVKNIAPQSLTGDAARRRENIRNVYVPFHEELIPGKRVLLIDDIVTTGSTLTEGAGILRSAGAVNVVAMTVARAKE